MLTPRTESRENLNKSSPLGGQIFQLETEKLLGKHWQRIGQPDADTDTDADADKYTSANAAHKCQLGKYSTSISVSSKFQVNLLCSKKCSENSVFLGSSWCVWLVAELLGATFAGVLAKLVSAAAV